MGRMPKWRLSRSMSIGVTMTSAPWQHLFQQEIPLWQENANMSPCLSCTGSTGLPSWPRTPSKMSSRSSPSPRRLACSAETLGSCSGETGPSESS